MHLGLQLAAVAPTGDYINIWKCLPILLLLLIWAKLLTWVDKDTVAANMPRIPINAGLFGGFVLASIFFFWVPAGFWVALPVFLFIMLLEAGIYLGLRSQKAGLADVKEEFFTYMKGLTGKKKKEVTVVAGQVGIVSRGGSLLPVPDAEDAMRPAYDAVQQLLTEPLLKNAQRIDCAPDREFAVVKFQVDGFTYAAGTIPKADSQAAINYMKQAAGLDANEKRKPQKGTLKVVINSKKIELQIQTAGNASGEVIRLLADVKQDHKQRIADLGLADDQFQLILDAITDPTGVILVTSPKDQGLTTTLYAILREHDAFLSHIQSLEREPAQDLEGVTQNVVKPGAAAGDETKQIQWMVSQEPDIIALSPMEENGSARELSMFAADKRAYVGMRANSTFEALAQWRKAVGDDKLAVKNLRLIINSRVLRKLCEACKVGFAPDPQTLRKLNLDAEITTLYQARTEPLLDPKGNPIPCTFCNDLHFKGRTGFFEVLQMDDKMREVILSGGSPEQLKAVFRKQRGRYLQESALLLVEKGMTSVQEVLRILRSEGSSGSKKAS